MPTGGLVLNAKVRGTVGSVIRVFVRACLSVYVCACVPDFSLLDQSTCAAVQPTFRSTTRTVSCSVQASPYICCGLTDLSYER